MKTAPPLVIFALVFATVPLLVCHAANAGKPPQQKYGSTATKRAVSAIPYTITLSLGRNWNTNDTGLPMTTVSFVSSSPHTLVFALTSRFAKFTVEYKTAQPGTASDTGWKILKSRLHLPPDTDGSSRIKPSQNHVILGRVPPLAQWSNGYDLVGFPMSADGFYRITADTNISDAREMDGPADSPALVRTFTLSLRSNSIIVRRTSSGFVEVSSATGKQPSPQ